MLQFPLIKITFGFILGLITAYYLQLTLPISIGSVVIALLLFLSAYWINLRKNTKSPYFEIATLFLSFTLGGCILLLHNDYNHDTNYSNYPVAFQKSNWIEGVIREKLKSNEYNDRFIVLVKKINHQHKKGKILLNLGKSTRNQFLEVGHQLRFKTKLKPTSSPKNPSQFDYAAYLKNKQIYAQAYVESKNILYHPSQVKDIWFFTSKLRNTIASNLEKSGFDHTSLAVAMALFLGQQQDIDSDITKDYQFAGAVHVLSVSGLHIGFIILVLNFLMQPIPNTRSGRFLKVTISIVSLIAFGFLAGLAPSVLRSITMFSFVAIGHYLRRSTNIYNTLAVSMLLILLVQPYFIFDIGFQLSYAALFFIVWLQPLLSSYWKPQTKVMQFFWDILTVSFAAQLGTLPLSIFYFHQFPGLFFVTNLVVLPLLSVIMTVGVFIMTASLFTVLPMWCYKPLEWGITIMNEIIHWVASFEDFIFTNIPSNSYLLLSSYILLAAMILCWKKISFNRLFTFLVSIIIFQFVVLKNKYDYGKSEEWVVLHAVKKTIICKRIGQEIEVFSNDTTNAETQKNSILQNYATATFSTIKKKSPLKNVAYFNGKRILIIDSNYVHPSTFDADIVLLTASPKINLDRYLIHNKPNIIVADGSNYTSLIEAWKKSCIQKKIPFHVTNEKGYFKI